MTFIFSFSGMFKPLADTPFPFLGYANPVCYSVGVLMRLVTKLIDDNFFAAAFATFAAYLPDYKEHAAKAGLTRHLRK